MAFYEKLVNKMWTFDLSQGLFLSSKMSSIIMIWEELFH